MRLIILEGSMQYLFDDENSRGHLLISMHLMNSASVDATDERPTTETKDHSNHCGLLLWSSLTLSLRFYIIFQNLFHIICLPFIFYNDTLNKSGLKSIKPNSFFRVNGSKKSVKKGPEPLYMI